VLVLRRNGHWHRQVYVSLSAATRAMDRAKDKGIEARCVLCELVPVLGTVPTIVGDDR
jgi:hypothetical protein